MANKPKPPEKVKEVVILFRVTNIDKVKIVLKARKRGCKNISQYLRELISEDNGKGKIDVIC
jgi:hypothetical protein